MPGEPGYIRASRVTGWGRTRTVLGSRGMTYHFHESSSLKETSVARGRITCGYFFEICELKFNAAVKLSLMAQRSIERGYH